MMPPKPPTTHHQSNNNKNLHQSASTSTSRRGSVATTSNQNTNNEKQQPPPGSSSSTRTNNNNNNKQDLLANSINNPSASQAISPSSPQAIISNALSQQEQDDFRQAFWHHFHHSTSPVPHTITTRELGFIFKAFGQRVPESELRQIVNKYGSPLHVAAQHQLQANQHNHNNNNSGRLLSHHQFQQLLMMNHQQGNFSSSPSGQSGIGSGSFIGRKASFVDNIGSTPILSQSNSIKVLPNTPQHNNNNNVNNSRPGSIGGGGGGGGNTAAALQRAGSGTYSNMPQSAGGGGGGGSSSHYGSAPGTAQNNTKVLSWTQFMLVMAEKLKSGDSVQALEDAFDVFDVKGVGFVMSKELRQYMTMLGESRLTEAEVEQMILEADVDGDGTIDKDEFIKMLQK